MRRCRYIFLILVVSLAVCTVAGCEKPVMTESTPSCEEVVAHSDKLAIQWAKNESDKKGKELERLIRNAKQRGGEDRAVEMCEMELDDEQKRCIMRAETLRQKNECLGIEGDG